MSDITGAMIRTTETGPRAELDAEGVWYNDDGLEERVPWADYIASRRGLPWGLER